MILKKYYLPAISLLLMSFNLTAQTYTFTPKNTTEFHIHSQRKQLQLQYNMHSLDFRPTYVKGEAMQHIQLSNHIDIPGKAGTPALPVFNKNIAVPQGAVPTLQVTVKDSLVLSDINIAPNAQIPLDTEPDFPLTKGNIYKENTWYPKNIGALEMTEIRGLQVARLQFCPFKYNPLNKTLVVYKSIDIELSWTQDQGAYVEKRFRSPQWDAILQDYLVNYQDLEKIDYKRSISQNKTDDGCEYLILIPDDEAYHTWANKLKTFRNEQGIQTRVMTIPEVGGNTVSNLNSFFVEVYNNWNPVPSAVLLMADYAEDESGFVAKRFGHPNEGTYVSDNYYADVTNNKLPDFVFARMTANNETELATMVNKCINYESNPPQEESFYQEPITALGWQTERWFQICSEVVGGYMRNHLGKNPVRINAVYKGNPATDPWSTADNTYTILNHFGPNGLGYIPETPDELGGWTGGTGSDVVNAINKGACMLMHRDHGFYGGWGEPGFTSNQIKQLNNSNKLLHVFSVNCLTGRFDTGEGSFAERMHRYEKGGALSITAASQVSFSFTNDALVWGMMDNMWPDFLPSYGAGTIAERDFLPAFGLAAGKYFLSNSNWAAHYYKTITYRLFHHHGDAFNTVYYEMPKNNDIVHDKYILDTKNSIEVEALPGSLVGLSQNETLLSSAIIPENGKVTLNFPNQTAGASLKIVITKQNYLRYESDIEIIEPQDIILCLNKIKYNDANANDSIESGETVNVSLWLKNLGTQTMNTPIELHLNSTSSGINITQDSYTLNTLGANEQLILDNIFSFDCSYNVDDLETIPISISINGEVYEFSTTAYASKLQWSALSFEETAGGNGNDYIDPGENVIVRLSAKNIGHANVPTGTLSISNVSSNIDLSHSTQNFEHIAKGDSIIVECNISCDASVPIHSIANFTAQINAAPIVRAKDFYFSIGQILEDWENATFETFNWKREGDAQWDLSTKYKYDGEYAAASPDLAHNQEASLVLYYDCMGNDFISFYIMISSEFKHDYLSFYIDDELQDQWSKLVLFNKGYQRFPVSAGKHCFRWTYAKDEAGASGLDKCWLDHIVLPAGEDYDNIEEYTSANNTDKFMVYPNPAKDLIYISNKTKTTENLHVELWNTMGQKVIEQPVNKSTSTVNISTNTVSDGIYFIRILNNDRTISETHKILINK